MHFDFGTESPACEDGAARAASLTRRQAALMAIWQVIRLLDEEERGAIMVELRSIFAGRNYSPCPGRAMTREEVRALVMDGLVTIGAHTVTHPVLSTLGATACHREITESKIACEALIGARVAGFAYPYGDLDAKARRAVRDAGFCFRVFHPARANQHGI